MAMMLVFGLGDVTTVDVEGSKHMLDPAIRCAATESRSLFASGTSMGGL